MPSRDEWKARCEAEIGKPYIWGASGPDSYDCSGFVQWALGLLGLDPAGDQTAEGLYRYFRRAGHATAVSDAQADLGDIVFYGGEEAVSHIALAWGGLNILEAGGGGHTTTTPAAAHAVHAEVRIKPIHRRADLVAILRPTALTWTRAHGLEAAEAFGRYQPEQPTTTWLQDGRNMQLNAPFGYIQQNGREWPVPAEAIVDGASIPQVFWSLIGGPLEGKYRYASVVHDYYCDVKSRTWPDTHRVFYDGMMCSGVNPVKAKVMYYAVYRFGPRWELSKVAAAPGLESFGDETAEVATPIPVEAFDPESFAADVKIIQETDPNPAVIEALARARAPLNA